ncbi:MFS transporter [Sphingomonas sp. CL5.1]|uniref:MFS transporter n=1 Tax=Sphingomonas sp. CL5.1 TaxID=2653203 RepID=UPI0015830DCB|nr:MFS transporter [Sphingomonas sp. CL5.1]QKR98401.1 MFS transporter [Sphingomonas sp. CL5.1]
MGARAGRFYPRYLVGVLALINAISYLDRQVMSILLSPIQADRGFSDTELGVLIGPAFMLLFVLAGMPMGRIADRHHRGLLLAAGIFIWSACTLATAFAPTFWTMAAARAGVGLGEACVVPAAYSLISDYFAPDRRARAIAWVTIGIPVGAGLALFGGGLLLKAFAPLAGRPFLGIGPTEPWAMVLLVFALAGFVVAALALTIIDPRKAPSITTTALDPAGSFPAFLRAHPLGLILVLLPYILLTFVQVAMIAWVPTLLTRRHGLSPADAATLYGALTFVVPVVATLCGGWIADRLLRFSPAGPFLLVTWLAPLFLPGVLLFALPHSITLVVTGLFITLAVGGVCSTTVYAAVQTVAPAGFRGRILALYGLLAQLAGVGAGPLVVALVTDHVFHDRAMLHLAIVAVVTPAWLVTVWCGFAGRRHYAALRAAATE